MKLIINYKNGNEVKMDVHYVHTEDGKLYFTVKENPHEIFQTPVSVPLENIENFKVIMKGEISC